MKRILKRAIPELVGQHSGLTGNLTWLRGNCSGLSGDCTGLSGDLDACGLTLSEREAGVEISELVDRSA